MVKYQIDLPGDRKIKFRVTKETSDWVLVEAIIDTQTLQIMKHFASEGENVPEEVVETTTDAETPTTPTVSPEVAAEVEAADVAKPASKKVVNPPKFNATQISKMKDIKNKMKIKENGELNPFVQDWSFGQGKDFSFLSESNIDAFIQFMYDNYLVAEE